MVKDMKKFWTFARIIPRSLKVLMKIEGELEKVEGAGLENNEAKTPQFSPKECFKTLGSF